MVVKARRLKLIRKTKVRSAWAETRIKTELRELGRLSKRAIGLPARMRRPVWIKRRRGPASDCWTMPKVSSGLLISQDKKRCTRPQLVLRGRANRNSSISNPIKKARAPRSNRHNTRASEPKETAAQWLSQREFLKILGLPHRQDPLGTNWNTRRPPNWARYSQWILSIPNRCSNLSSRLPVKRWTILEPRQRNREAWKPRANSTRVMTSSRRSRSWK